jgi:aryl-alcohol dehydrogenase-like predicted oxidoreductase
MDKPNLSAVQTVYNILEQTPGNELMKKAEEKDVGILVRVPEASGILTGKVNADTKFDEDFTRKALRNSLERLQTDHLDMYGLHNPKLSHIRDDSIFNVLDSFVADESIKTYQVALGPAIGWTQEGLEAMDKPNVSAVQTVYNILEQTPGNELMIKAEEKNVGILVRVPEASGILTGKVNADTKFDENDHRSVRKLEWIKASLKKVEQLKPIADRYGLNITEFAMKFMMTKKGFATVLPTMISEEEVINYAEMADGKYISTSDMKEIEELYNTWPSYELKATPQAN